jgi:hypothetical protein
MARKKAQETVVPGLLLTATGSTGVIELHEHKLVIKRPNAGGGCLNPFSGSGEKQFMLADITSIEFKAPKDKRDAGYIQFTFIGGQESKAIGGQIHNDENSVMFGLAQSTQFETLRLAVESKMVTYRAGRAAGGIQYDTGLDELTKPADFRDRGAISDKEFDEQKGRLLK